MSPQRIQLRRTKGWRKPQGAVVVSRPSKWGNPWRVERTPNWPRWGGTAPWDVVAPNGQRLIVPRGGRVIVGRAEADAENHRRAALLAVDEFARDRRNYAYPSDAEVRAELAGRDLCCWCALDAPCHVDVLLEIANSGADQ